MTTENKSTNSQEGIKSPEEILRNSKHLFEDQVDALNTQFGGGFVKAVCGVIEEYHNQFTTAIPEDVEALKKEIERLKGLVRKAFDEGFNTPLGAIREEYWQPFKTEKNL